VKSGKELRSLVHINSATVDMAVYSLAFGRDGKIHAGNGDGTISEWDTASGKETRTWKAHHGSAFKLVFSHQYSLLASIGGDAYLKLWDTTTGSNMTAGASPLTLQKIISSAFTTGEDWNGNGGGNSDLGQDVHAVANGRVTFAQDCGRLWGNVITIEHYFYENHERRKIISLYAHLNEIKVNEGAVVQRRQVIATVGQDPDKLFAAHLHLELRWDDSLSPTYWPSSNGKDEAWVKKHYANPSTFINEHRKHFIPQKEQKLIVVDQESYKARFYQAGVLKSGVRREFWSS
jgi:murein DD-endopeptidase MepM/ murein hydrolase activator NlpD